MKKLFTFIPALAIALSLYVTAFAAANDTSITPGSENKTGSTSVTYTVQPAYTVTIPATVTLGNSVTVSAEDVKVNKGSYVAVKLTGTSEMNNTFKVKTDEGAELVYTVKNGEENVNIGDTVLAVNPYDADNGNATLSFSAPASVTYAGTYKGTVTFTVSVDTVPMPK